MASTSAKIFSGWGECRKFIGKTNQDQIKLKTVRDLSPNYALFRHTTNSPSQSCQTVPLKLAKISLYV